jgi:hypothetical protein
MAVPRENAGVAHCYASVARTNFDFQIEIVPADGIRLPFSGSGDFGTSPFLGAALGRGNFLDRM